jgi:hypothetical protein
LSSGIYCRVKWFSTDVSEVHTASIIRDEIFDWRFRGAYCLYHQGWDFRPTFQRCILPPSSGMSDHLWWWRQYSPLKRRSTIILHGSISQKTTLNIFLLYLTTHFQWLRFYSIEWRDNKRMLSW